VLRICCFCNKKIGMRGKKNGETHGICKPCAKKVQDKADKMKLRVAKRMHEAKLV
jgi:hypothetical protein